MPAMRPKGRVKSGMADSGSEEEEETTEEQLLEVQGASRGKG